MRFLASTRWRLFLTVWLVYTVHFATNVVREHYPAFSIVDDFSFKVDRYLGFDPTIFEHRDGHAYIGNNVIVSVFAAVPLFFFDPVLDALERRSLAKLDATGTPPTAQYETDKPNRQRFFRLVTENGLELRFGGATVVTSAFLMAPLSALAVVLMFHILIARGVATGLATSLAMLFALATPMFFRTAPLTHNMFLMYAVFLAFYCLWVRPEQAFPVSPNRTLAAGFFAGLGVAVDYAGVVPFMCLFLYLVINRVSSASWKTAMREATPFIVGAVPPILFLLYSQWAMYGNPILPGQHWMPDAQFTERGWRGFDWPSLSVFMRNLFDPAFGMYVFGPLLVLGLLPARYAEESLILPRRERWFVALFILAFLVFNAANQYSLMQFNTGFRYLAPLLPFVFLQASDHLVRMPRYVLWPIAVLALFHSWVMAVGREPVLESYRILVTEGPQLPWLRVFRLTIGNTDSFVHQPVLVPGILMATISTAVVLWWYGARVAAKNEQGI